MTIITRQLTNAGDTGLCVCTQRAALLSCADKCNTTAHKCNGDTWLCVFVHNMLHHYLVHPGRWSYWAQLFEFVCLDVVGS